jgi:hypothetical protein
MPAIQGMLGQGAWGPPAVHLQLEPRGGGAPHGAAVTLCGMRGARRVCLKGVMDVGSEILVLAYPGAV